MSRCASGAQQSSLPEKQQGHERRVSRCVSGAQQSSPSKIAESRCQQIATAHTAPQRDSSRTKKTQSHSLINSRDRRYARPSGASGAQQSSLPEKQQGQESRVSRCVSGAQQSSPSKTADSRCQRIATAHTAPQRDCSRTRKTQSHTATPLLLHVLLCMQRTCVRQPLYNDTRVRPPPCLSPTQFTFSAVRTTHAHKNCNQT